MNKKLQAKIDYSINLLQRAEPMALRMSDKGFFLAFSGGKDSQCLYHIAKEAGVKFEAHYQLTTLPNLSTSSESITPMSSSTDRR